MAGIEVTNTGIATAELVDIAIMTIARSLDFTRSSGSPSTGIAIAIAITSSITNAGRIGIDINRAAQEAARSFQASET